ncbi:MAG: protein kinase [Okeania sp. SIO3C4]|nr:protein kinase [Okeania sp. SIO3C4]
MTNKILRHRYKIISELGKGGFGTTYLAVDLDLPDRPQCVVKQLTPSDPRPQVFQVAKNLFDKEAKILHRLGKHEQIPQLFAYFEEGGQFYLVQEFIEGNDLTKEIYPGKKISEEQAIQLLTEILKILKYVHEENVIHRDLKPQNIMRIKSDGKIVLIDFGAVKEIKGLTLTSAGQTATTIVVGTPGYMPSEQAAGQPKFCSDLYAVGMMTIEALTGVPVNQFPKDSSTGEIIWKYRVNVSDDLGRVLDKMVLYDWRDRYHSIDEVLAELRIGSYSANPTTYQTTIPPGKPVNNPSTTLVGSTVVPNIGNLPQRQPLSSSNVPPVSASGIDYTKLRDLLATEKWKEANNQTNIVMTKAAKGKKLNSKNIKEIPGVDLQIIDQLWVKYSNGHFGFSVQKQIYLDTGNLPLKFRKETYKLFGEKVGWKLKRNWGFLGGWLSKDNIIFERKAARGHLPYVMVNVAGENVLVYILERLCEFWLLVGIGFVLACVFNGFLVDGFMLFVFWVFIRGVSGNSVHLWYSSLVWSHNLICTLSQKLDEHHSI